MTRQRAPACWPLPGEDVARRPAVLAMAARGHGRAGSVPRTARAAVPADSAFGSQLRAWHQDYEHVTAGSRPTRRVLRGGDAADRRINLGGRPVDPVKRLIQYRLTEFAATGSKW